MNPRYGMAEPLSPLVPITDPGAGSAVHNPCKIGSLCWKPEHPNQSVWYSCPSTITVASLEHPTKQAMGPGLRKGTRVTSGHSFL